MKEKRGLLITIAIVVFAIAIAFIFKKQDKKDLDKIYESKFETQVDAKKNELDSSSSSEGEAKLESNDKSDDGKKDDQTKSIPTNDFYINDEAIFNKIMDEDKPVILMFGTSDCIFCKQMRPIVEKLSKEYKEDINIKYIDAYENPNIAYKYPIRGVPAFLYKNEDKSGYLPSAELVDLLQTVNGLTSYSAPNSDSHDITMTYGMMEEKTLVKIIEELVANAK